jgi:NAD(P)-dependent dehydrogenase (short-subunit alcohol dehydrogenase family)
MGTAVERFGHVDTLEYASRGIRVAASYITGEILHIDGGQAAGH